MNNMARTGKGKVEGKVVWKGHPSSKPNALNKFSTNVNTDEQITSFRQRQGLGPQEANEGSLVPIYPMERGRRQPPWYRSAVVTISLVPTKHSIPFMHTGVYSMLRGTQWTSKDASSPSITSISLTSKLVFSIKFKWIIHGSRIVCNYIFFRRASWAWAPGGVVDNVRVSHRSLSRQDLQWQVEILDDCKGAGVEPSCHPLACVDYFKLWINRGMKWSESWEDEVRSRREIL